MVAYDDDELDIGMLYKNLSCHVCRVWIEKCRLISAQLPLVLPLMMEMKKASFLATPLKWSSLSINKFIYRPEILFITVLSQPNSHY